jgi:hypothetical protein
LVIAFSQFIDPVFYGFVRYSGLGNDFALARRLNSALETVSRLNLALTLIQSTGIDSIFSQSRKLALDLMRNLTYTLTKVHSRDVNQLLKTLYDQIPDPEDNWNNGMEWWREYGSDWLEQLRNVMLDYCNIARDWQFASKQSRLLEQYLSANLLLVECLNSECYVSRSVREEIETTLLLSFMQTD